MLLDDGGEKMNYSDKMEKYGVMSMDDFRQMTLDIASGKYRPSPDAPRIIFGSHKGLAEYAEEKAKKEESPISAR